MDILTLEEVKDYLRVEREHTKEDGLINTIIAGAENYLKDHVGTERYEIIKNGTGIKSKAKIYLHALVSEWYDNRGITTISDSLQNTINLLGIQLQYGGD